MSSAEGKPAGEADVLNASSLGNMIHTTRYTEDFESLSTTHNDTALDSTLPDASFSISESHATPTKAPSNLGLRTSASGSATAQFAPQHPAPAKTPSGLGRTASGAVQPSPAGGGGGSRRHLGPPASAASLRTISIRNLVVKYSVTIETSDVEGAGCDSDVEFVFVGTAGESMPYVLKSKTPAGRGRFQRGSMDTFEFLSPDLGHLIFVELKVLNGQKWHLSQIDVDAGPDDAPGGDAEDSYSFPYAAWIENGHAVIKEPTAAAHSLLLPMSEAEEDAAAAVAAAVTAAAAAAAAAGTPAPATAAEDRSDALSQASHGGRSHGVGGGGIDPELEGLTMVKIVQKDEGVQRVELASKPLTPARAASPSGVSLTALSGADGHGAAGAAPSGRAEPDTAVHPHALAERLGSIKQDPSSRNTHPDHAEPGPTAKAEPELRSSQAGHGSTTPAPAPAPAPAATATGKPRSAQGARPAAAAPAGRARNAGSRPKTTPEKARGPAQMPAEFLPLSPPLEGGPQTFIRTTSPSGRPGSPPKYQQQVYLRPPSDLPPADYSKVRSKVDCWNKMEKRPSPPKLQPYMDYRPGTTDGVGQGGNRSGSPPGFAESPQRPMTADPFYTAKPKKVYLNAEQLKQSVERLSRPVWNAPSQPATSRPVSPGREPEFGQTFHPWLYAMGGTKRISEERLSGMVTRLYKVKETPRLEPWVPKRVQFKYDANTSRYTEILVENARKSPDDLTKGILERLQEGLKKSQKIEAELQAKYLKPLGTFKKYGPSQEEKEMFEKKLSKLYEGGRTIDAEN